MAFTRLVLLGVANRETRLSGQLGEADVRILQKVCGDGQIAVGFTCKPEMVCNLTNVLLFWFSENRKLAVTPDKERQR